MDVIQHVVDSLEGAAYVVDADGVIIAVGQRQWAAFARANGTEALADSATVVGRSLFDFIAGEPVRRFWRAALDQVAGGEVESVVLPCRCDSPALERHIRVALTRLALPGRDGLFLFHVVVVDERIRPPMGLFAPSSGPLVALCSFCHAVRAEEGGPWRTPEAYYAGGGSARVTVTHSVCPDCHDTWMRSLGLG